MNKKAFSLPMEQLIGIIILVIFLAIIFGAFFRPEKGWLNYIASKAESFARFVPGRDQILHPEDLQLPSGIQSAYNSLSEKMNALSISTKTQCWGNYTVIPELNEVKIFIKNTTDGLSIYAVNKEGQKLEPTIIPGFKPCIIAGKIQDTVVASAFRQYYILPATHSQSLLSYMYKEVNSIEINEPLWGTSSDINADGTKYNLDYSLLYKHDSTHICLIPNFNWGSTTCIAAMQGLEDFCFKNKIIQNKINNQC